MSTIHQGQICLKKGNVQGASLELPYLPIVKVFEKHSANKLASSHHI